MNIHSFAAFVFIVTFSFSVWAQTERFEYFDNGNIKIAYTYHQNQLTERKHYSIQGHFTVHYFFESKGTSVIVTSVDPKDSSRIISKEEWSHLTPTYEKSNQSIHLKTWIFKNNIIQSIDHLDLQGRIVKKELFNENKKTSTIFYYYNEKEENAYAFKELDLKGQTISSYRHYETYKRTHHLNKINSASNVDFILKTHADSHLKIAVIDSGFDYNHKNLAHKFYQNPLEQNNSHDDDGNGWVDDTIGWDQKSNTNLPAEITTALQKNNRPLSHGTHVADIALGHLENVHLIGFGGDYTQAAYIERISQFLKKHKVHVVNMSIGLPRDPKNEIGLRDAYKAYERMMQENPDTLFVVAAGNSGLSLDEQKFKQYPASTKLPNSITVGSADISHLDQMVPHKNRISSFSNWGRDVDIYSPGKEVVAANLGGGVIAHSGTSMASPIIAHTALRLLTVNKELTPTEIKEILISTVAPMEKSDKITTQGIVDINAALFEARLRKVQQISLQKNGPNCWNSSLYLAGVNNGIHYTDEVAFRTIIDSPLCKEISKTDLQTGDVIALRRYANNKLLPASMLSEVHAYTYWDSNQTLTKNGPHRDVGYKMSSMESVLQDYKKQEHRNCKMLGLDKSQCDLQQRFYRCDNLDAHANSILEKSILNKLRQIEQTVEENFKGNHISNENLIRDLQTQLNISEIPNWLRSHYETVLETLQSKF